MRVPTTDHCKPEEYFFLFRFLYNEQLKACNDCIAAFQQAKNLFHHQHAFCPYDQLEEYLLELFLFNSAYFNHRN